MIYTLSNSLYTTSMKYPTFTCETELLQEGYTRIGGIDEAGRGAWAGPLVAGCVVLPHDFGLRGWGVNDSKKLSPKKREEINVVIKTRALDFGIGSVSPEEIFSLGLSRANRLAMERAVAALSKPPDYLLIDAFRIKSRVPMKIFIKGDALVASIAAASIIAKVERDRRMVEYGAHYPNYGFEKHKGYGTKAHQECLTRHGLCDIHRRSFKPIRAIHNVRRISPLYRNHS